MNRAPVSRRHRWLLVIPFLWQVAAAPLVNDVDLRIFALPFPMAWQVAGVLIASIVIAVCFSIDRRAPEFDADGRP